MNVLINGREGAEIGKLIFSLRGKQVILDRELARLYQVEVAQMNRQVKRNIERFPEDFMFQLTKEELESLKCQNGISNSRGGDRTLPYAFTELGKKWFGFTKIESISAQDIINHLQKQS